MTIHGAEIVQALIERVRAGIQDGLPEARSKAADIAFSAVPGYPPELPNQQYIRTFDLGESITNGPGGVGGSLISLGAQTILSVGVPYAQWVVNEPTQAAIHQGRWWTIQKIVKQITPDVVMAYIETIRALIRG